MQFTINYSQGNNGKITLIKFTGSIVERNEMDPVIAAVRQAVEMQRKRAFVFDITHLTGNILACCNGLDAIDGYVRGRDLPAIRVCAPRNHEQIAASARLEPEHIFFSSAAAFYSFFN